MPIRRRRVRCTSVIVPGPGSAGLAFGQGSGLAGHAALGCPADFAGSCLDFVRLPSISSPFAVAIGNAPRVMPRSYFRHARVLRRWRQDEHPLTGDHDAWNRRG